MRKISLKIGIFIVVTIILLIVTICLIINANGKVDAIFYKSANGGEIIGNYEYDVCFNSKKMIYIDNSKVVSFTSNEDGNERKIETSKNTTKEYTLNQEHIDKFKNLIKKIQDKNEQVDEGKNVKLKLKVDGKEYAVGDYDTEWDEITKSVLTQ